MKLIRFLKFFLGLLSIIALVLLINSMNGSAKFVFDNYGIEIPFSYFLTALLIFSVLLIGFYKLWKMLWAIPLKYQLYLKKKRSIKAQNLILDSFSSLAALQPEEAQNSATLAAHLDPHNPLVFFLEAKSAQILGNKEKSTSLFYKMLKEPRLTFLALHGLILDFKEKKDYLKVNEFLNIAIKNRHDSPWVLNEILENDLRLINNGLKGCGEKNTYYKLLSSEQYAKHLSFQYFLMAKKQVQLHDLEGAKESLKKALNENPNNLGAALALIPLYPEVANHKLYKLLLKTAKGSTHPVLLDSLLVFGGFESPTQAYQSLSEQLSHHDYETALFLSQLAQKAHLFEIAKHFAELAIKILPTKRTKDSIFSLLKMMNVDPFSYNHPPLQEDYGWICTACYKHQDDFNVICPICNSVDKIEYTNKSVKIHNMVESANFLLTGS